MPLCLPENHGRKFIIIFLRSAALMVRRSLSLVSDLSKVLAEEDSVPYIDARKLRDMTEKTPLRLPRK